MKKADVLRLILIFFGLSKKYTDTHGGDTGAKSYTFTDDGDGNITIAEES